MKKALLGLLAVGLSQTVSAADAVKIDQPWARPTVEGMRNGGAFMMLENQSGKDDVLVGASTPVAKYTEIHEHVLQGDVMRMREVKGGLPLKANESVALKPGGYHVMLMGLKQPLQTGSKFPLTLKFKHAKPQTVEVEVKKAMHVPEHGHHHEH